MSAPTPIADNEWLMIEAACHNQKLKSHSAYMDCLSRQVKALEVSPGKPSLATLSDEERVTIESACKVQRLAHGPAAYYNCLRQQLATPHAMAANSSTLAAKRKEQAVENPPGREAPHPSSPGSRTAPPASTSAAAAKQQAEPTAQPAVPDSAGGASPTGAATPAPTAFQLEVLVIVIVAAVAAWLSWKAYRGARGPKCAKCGRRFKGSGAYCLKCIAVFQKATRQTAAQPHHAEEQARAEEWNRQRQRAADDAHEHRQHAPPPASEPASAFDPYAVLGVARNASKEEIRAAYLRQMAIYHPDKVAHLGDDLQELAKRKAQAINRAYEELLQAT